MVLEGRPEDRVGVDRLREAATCFERAAGVLDRLHAVVVRSEGRKLRLVEQTSELFPRMVGVRLRLAQSDGTNRADELRLAWEAAERGEARVFLEALGRSRAAEIGGPGPTLRRRGVELRDQLAGIDTRVAAEDARPFDRRDGALVSQLLDQRLAVERELEGLEDRMVADFPRYRALRTGSPCSIEEARACLAEDEVALEYVVGSAASYLVVVSKSEDAGGGGIEVHRLPPADELGDLVASLTGDRSLDDAEVARELGLRAYRTLLGPAARAIRGKSLVVIPGGILGRLPFELLVKPGPGEAASTRGSFLVVGHRVRYAPSMTTLAVIRPWARPRPRPARPFWAAGDPAYEADAPRVAPGPGGPRPAGGTPDFRRLIASGEEVERVRSLIGASPDDVRLGPAASESAVKALSAGGALSRYRVLHFAAHGSLGPGPDGDRPSLVLALRGDLRGEDGFFHLEEIMNLRLNADLVVLSACQSGRSSPGEAGGVGSLARAFLHAGSAGVLGSLWRVDDRATAELMVAFYENLKVGHRAAEALRAARIRMIEADKPPRHWAPFILIGQ